MRWKRIHLLTTPFKRYSSSKRWPFVELGGFDFDDLEDIETKLKKSHTERRKSQEQTAIVKMKKNPKAFFGYAKRFSKTKSEVGPFLDNRGDTITSPEAIAEKLREQYDSVFSTPDTDL